MFSLSKSLSTFSIIFICITSSYGQSIARSAIGSAGVNLQQESITLQSIAGQSSLTVNRQGFIQPHGLQLIRPSRTIKIYPNPTQHESYISGVVKGDIITIYNIDGRQLKSVASNSFIKQPIVLEDFPNGVYLVKVTGVFEYNTIKLIKTN